MLVLNTVAAAATILASIGVIVTTFVVWRQVRLQASSVNTDTRRFLRESIVIVHQTLQDQDFHQIRRANLKAWRDKEPQDLTPDEQSAAKRLLGVYGLLSRLVEKRAIDEEIFREYWLSTLLRDWMSVKSFVMYERDRQKNPKLYVKTEELVERWVDGP